MLVHDLEVRCGIGVCIDACIAVYCVSCMQTVNICMFVHMTYSVLYTVFVSVSVRLLNW